MPLVTCPVEHLRGLSEHGGGAGTDGLIARPPDIAECQGQEADADHQGSTDNRPGELEFGCIGVDQHHRSEQEGDKATQSKHQGRVEGLRDQEREAQQHERQPGVVHRQHVEGIQTEDKADGANYARHDCPGVAEFENEAVDADQHQNERHIWVGDHCEQPDEPSRLVRPDRQVPGGQPPLLAHDLHFPPVNAGEELLGGPGNDVDDSLVQGR